MAEGVSRSRVVAAAVLTSTTLLAVSASQAAVTQGRTAPPPSDCPPVMSVSEVARGMTGTGWVTAEGRTPEPFTADVLGVLPSALGPGRDVVVVRVSGPSIQRAGGAWYGMSGAPVYVGEKLLGAVSFQLSFGPSSVVGLTAAEDMAPVLSYPTASADGSAPPRASTRPIPLPASTRETVAESTETSPSDVGSLVQLRLPLSVSGVSARAMRRVTRAIRREDAPFLAYSGASAAPRGSAAPAGSIGPGQPFASVFSYGDVTLAATGTTTLVCAGKALAFGHPLLWQGRTSVGANAADVVTVVPDPVLSPYALANVAEGVGKVDQDRLAGIRGLIGPLPASIPIRSTVAASNTGATRSGESVATTSTIVPAVAFLHLLGNIDVTFDQITPGSSNVRFRISGTREDGRAFEFGRSNMWVSHWDISQQSVEELSMYLNMLLANPFEDIDFTRVEAITSVDEDVREYRIGKVLVARGRGKYRDVRRIDAAPGSIVRLLVHVKPNERSAARRVKMRLRVPARARPRGAIEITGGRFGEEFFFCLFEPEAECGPEFGPGVKTFDHLLQILRRQPRNNVLVARLRTGERGRVVAADRVALDRVVHGFRFIGVGPGGGEGGEGEAVAVEVGG